MIHVITACSDKDITRDNLQTNRRIINQIRYIHAIGNKIISVSTKPKTPDHIGYVVNITLRFEWYNSIFSKYNKIVTSTTFSALFSSSLIPPLRSSLYQI